MTTNTLAAIRQRANDGYEVYFDALDNACRVDPQAHADIAALLAIVDALTARAEAAEAALRELVSDTAAADREPNHWMKESAQAGVTSDEFATYCVYCRSNDEDYKQITHAPECPIARGQALLALAAHAANGESAGNGGA